MKLLALDTSTEACSVALWSGQHHISLDEVCPQQHSKRLLPMVQQVLAEAGISLQQLDGIVFGRGPGSFTGVRIGVGVAQGLAFGADLPVYGVSTLAAMAQGAARLHNAQHVVAAIDARMAEIYVASFAYDSHSGCMRLLGQEQAIKPQTISQPWFELTSEPCWGVGTGWQTYAAALQQIQQVVISPSILYPSAQDMLTLAQTAYGAGEFFAAELAEPSYVRDEVTWQKLPGR